mmetsp:Transcript_12785/g.26978  ORF Transcript_12785/g.26978 Transcript_12785/m.26978 type:complete len:213 (+) Transcript_12785:515-1153(+)
MRSRRLTSYCWRSMASRSAFFWARPQYRFLPPNSLPFMASTAFDASVGLSKLTKPNPLDLPDSSRMITTLVMLPNSPNLVRRASSVVSSAKFLTNTFVYIGCFSSLGRSPFFMKGPTYTFLPFSSIPLTVSTAFTAASSVSKCTKPYPLLLPASVATLHERMVPKALNVSCRALLSMLSSRFLMKMFPTPLLRCEGSLWLHMIRMGLPLIGV